MGELKNCPFCGSHDCNTRRHYNKFGDVWWGVKCYKCGAEVVNKLYDLPTDAMDAWNKRAGDGRKAAD